MLAGVSEILIKISQVRIAIYGDFCLDSYLIMNPKGSEISVETGQQAEAVEKHYQSLGGAGNVVANVVALQPWKVKAIGVIGNDMHGREIMRQLQKLNVNTESLFIQSNKFDTYTFTKKYVREREISRTDFGVFNDRSKKIDDQILESLRFALENYDVLIFNQQVPGSIQNPTFIHAVNDLFEEFSDKKILLDSRQLHHQFKNVSLKLNQIEVARLNGTKLDYQDQIPLSEVVMHGKKVFESIKKPIYITFGKNGMVVIDNKGVNRIPGIEISSKIDAVGAGDTALSTLALCLGAGFSSIQAANLANLAGAVSVQKLRTTGTASAEEILQMSRHATFCYQPELAENINLARYYIDEGIELCYNENEMEFGEIKHVVFDHDGTLSTLREGWEKIMESIMVEAILGTNRDTIDSKIMKKVRKTCADYIDKSTGVQTIVQMEKLVKLVDRFGFVDKNRILDASGYKNIFKKAILILVNHRLDKIHNGELNPEDFMIKGTIKFLEKLKKKNVKLYLVSGTDQEDVINEAKIMGYAHFFDKIYGSVDDLAKYSKKKVFKGITKENNLNKNELLVFGDGPVEMQECRRFDGIAVGVASDELNPGRRHPGKRTRLIKSGAQIIVFDYLQGSKLMDLLFNDKGRI